MASFAVSEEEEKKWLFQYNVWTEIVTPLLLNCAYRLCRWKMEAWNEYLHAIGAPADVAPEGIFRVVVISGGLTNKLYKCQLMPPSQPNMRFPKRSVVLLRIYGVGTEHLFDKNAEIIQSIELGRARVGPKVYSTFATGRIEQWIEGKALIRQQLADVYISKQIARKLARFHKFQMPDQFVHIPKNPSLRVTLNKWMVEYKRAQPNFRTEREVSGTFNCNLSLIII